MEIPHEMTTLSQVMEKLRIKKLDNEFRWQPEGFSAGKGKVYHPEDLEIIKVYRFEGITDPADMSVLYVIEAKDGLIGYSIDAYGVYSSHDDEEGYDNFIRLIPKETTKCKCCLNCKYCFKHISITAEKRGCTFY